LEFFVVVTNELLALEKGRVDELFEKGRVDVLKKTAARFKGKLKTFLIVFFHYIYRELHVFVSYSFRIIKNAQIPKLARLWL
jgi:hypothetical protein